MSFSVYFRAGILAALRIWEAFIFGMWFTTYNILMEGLFLPAFILGAHCLLFSISNDRLALPCTQWVISALPGVSGSLQFDRLLGSCVFWVWWYVCWDFGYGDQNLDSRPVSTFLFYFLFLLSSLFCLWDSPYVCIGPLDRVPMTRETKPTE